MDADTSDKQAAKGDDEMHGWTPDGQKGVHCLSHTYIALETENKDPDSGYSL